MEEEEGNKKRLAEPKETRSSLEIQNKSLHTIALSAGIFLLILLFLVHHKTFLNSHLSSQDHSLFTRMVFYLFYAFPLVTSFLGSIYLILTWSPKILKAAHESVIINTMSNLSFCIYMVHFCVLETDKLMITHRYSFYFYDMVSFWAAHVFYTVVLAIFLALAVELPCASLWRSYADLWFLSAPKDTIGGNKGGKELGSLDLDKRNE